LPLVFGVAVIAIAATACTPQQQAYLYAPAVYNTVADPNVPVQDKACAVLSWGLPIAQERITTLTVKQQSYANAAATAAVGYCTGKDLTWQVRAVQAADALSKVLWDVIK
jgi:hypothetical protein